MTPTPPPLIQKSSAPVTKAQGRTTLLGFRPVTRPLRGQRSLRPQPKPRAEAANRTPLPASAGEAWAPRVGRGMIHKGGQGRQPRRTTTTFPLDDVTSRRQQWKQQKHPTRPQAAQDAPAVTAASPLKVLEADWLGMRSALTLVEPGGTSQAGAVRSQGRSLGSLSGSFAAARCLTGCLRALGSTLHAGVGPRKPSLF